MVGTVAGHPNALFGLTYHIYKNNHPPTPTQPFVYFDEMPSSYRAPAASLTYEATMMLPSHDT